MSKEYVMQLESTIENLRRDNKILKEELSKYKAIDSANPSEALECLEEIIEQSKNLLEQTNNEFGENGTPYWFDDKAETIKQALTTKSKKELDFDEFDKYITNLYKHRNDYEKKMLYEFEIDNAVIRASTIEEIYNKFKEVMRDDK